MSDDKFILSPYIRVEIEKDEFWYLVGSKQEILTDTSLKDNLLLFFNFLLKEKSLLEINNYIDAVKNQETKKFIIDGVKNKNWLINYNYNKSNIFSRHHLFFNYLGLDFLQTQTKIQNTHITILGCGALDLI